jgi:hypothetical protein
MAGLMLFGALFIWLFVVIQLARWLTRAAKVRDSLRRVVLFALVVFIFLLPVADELAARPAFEALCREGAVLRIDAQKIRGRVVRVEIGPEQPVLGIFTPIPIHHSHVAFRDASTGDLLGEYDTYRADGGLLGRQLRPLGPSGPLTGTYSCVPKDEGTISKRYAFHLVN